VIKFAIILTLFIAFMILAMDLHFNTIKI